MKTQKEIFEYNTKNAGKQLISLTRHFEDNMDMVSKTDMIESVRQVAMHMLSQYEEHKDKFEQVTKKPKKPEPIKSLGTITHKYGYC